jgi:hypothetical protein
VAGGIGGRAHPTFTGSPTEHVGASLPSAWACSACLQAKAVRAACGKGSPGKLARCAPGIYLAWPQVRQLRRYPATAVLRILAGVAVAKHAICVCAMSAPSGAFLNKNKTLNMH